MEMAKVTSKGQITIPVSIRRRLCINEGDKILFIDRPDGVIMVNPDLLQGGKPAESSEFGTRSSELGTKRTEPGARAGVDDGVVIDAATDAVVEAEVEVEAETVEGDDDGQAEDIATAAEAPAAAGNDAAKDPGSPGKQVQGLNLSELLNEIRSIGSNI